MLACAAGLAAISVQPTQAGPLTFNVLHTVTGPPDGIQPFDGLYRDTHGNFTDLLDFPHVGGKSGYFANNIIRDNHGDFFGMMQDGGETDCGAQLAGCGTIFELTH